MQQPGPESATTRRAPSPSTSGRPRAERRAIRRGRPGPAQHPGEGVHRGAPAEPRTRSGDPAPGSGSSATLSKTVGTPTQSSSQLVVPAAEIASEASAKTLPRQLVRRRGRRHSAYRERGAAIERTVSRIAESGIPPRAITTRRKRSCVSRVHGPRRTPGEGVRSGAEKDIGRFGVQARVAPRFWSSTSSEPWRACSTEVVDDDQGREWSAGESAPCSCPGSSRRGRRGRSKRPPARHRAGGRARAGPGCEARRAARAPLDWRGPAAPDVPRADTRSVVRRHLEGAPDQEHHALRSLHRRPHRLGIESLRGKQLAEVPRGRRREPLGVPVGHLRRRRSPARGLRTGPTPD